jgi:hypothetical protein|nr:MAG TPA: hypothetical protein [Caudoviricetes sp.]
MNKPYAQRTPIGFVDNDGYVTPFNGRIVDNLPGRYIYTQVEMDFYLGQQQLMEQERENRRFGAEIEDAEVVTPPEQVLNNPVPVAPQPPIPDGAIARPMDPAVPPTYTNLTEEQMADLPSGLNGNAVLRQVMSTK